MFHLPFLTNSKIYKNKPKRSEKASVQYLCVSALMMGNDTGATFHQQ